MFPCWATSGRYVSSDTNRQTHSRIMGKLLCEDSKCISADPSSQHTHCFRISSIQKPPHCLLLLIDLCVHGSRVDCNCSVHVWLYTISENYHFHCLLILLPTVAPVLKKGEWKCCFPVNKTGKLGGIKRVEPFLCNQDLGQRVPTDGLRLKQTFARAAWTQS